MRWHLVFHFLALGLMLSAITCAPQLGDSCMYSTDCPEDAICDTSAVGGYCLIYDCTADSCPDGAVCISFGTFNACMDYCSEDGDCRTGEGYVCRTDLPPTSFCYQPLDQP